MKWPIPSNSIDHAEREEYWARTHDEDDYESVWTMTEDPSVLNKVVDSIRANNSDPKRILIPGCGSRTNLEEALVEAFPEANIYATDFPKVVRVAESNFSNPRVHYLAANSTELHKEFEKDYFDAAVIINSIVSETDRENRDILRSCCLALNPGGILVGFFPDVFNSLDVSLIEEVENMSGKEWRRQALDLPRSTYHEQHQDLEQIFYTPLRLRLILREAGFELNLMETFFCDSPEFIKQGRDYYHLEDDDLVLYENFVVAEK